MPSCLLPQPFLRLHLAYVPGGLRLVADEFLLRLIHDLLFHVRLARFGLGLLLVAHVKVFVSRQTPALPSWPNPAKPFRPRPGPPFSKSAICGSCATARAFLTASRGQ